MKKNLSPGVVVLIVAILVVVIGLVFWKGAGPGGNAKAQEDAIKATVATGGTMPAPAAPTK